MIIYTAKRGGSRNKGHWFWKRVWGIFCTIVLRLRKFPCRTCIARSEPDLPGGQMNSLREGFAWGDWEYNGRSAGTTDQILLHVHPEFSLFEEWYGHLFLFLDNPETVCLRYLGRFTESESNITNAFALFLIYLSPLYVNFQLHRLCVCWMMSNLLFANRV